MEVNLTDKPIKVIDISETLCYNCNRPHPAMTFVNTNYSDNSPCCPQCKVLKKCQEDLAYYDERITDLN